MSSHDIIDEISHKYVDYINNFLEKHGLNWDVFFDTYVMKRQIDITNTLTLVILWARDSTIPYTMHIRLNGQIVSMFNNPPEQETFIKMMIDAYIRQDEKFISGIKELYTREYESVIFNLRKESELSSKKIDDLAKIIFTLQAREYEDSQKIDWYKDVVKGLEYGRDKMTTQYNELQCSYSQLLNDIEGYKSGIKHLENGKSQMFNQYVECKKELDETVKKLNNTISKMSVDYEQLSTQCDKDKDLINGLIESISVMANQNDEMIKRIDELEFDESNDELTESLINEITRLKHENTMLYDKYTKSKIKSKVYRKRCVKVSTQLEDEKEKVSRLEKQIDVLEKEIDILRVEACFTHEASEKNNPGI